MSVTEHFGALFMSVTEPVEVPDMRPLTFDF